MINVIMEDKVGAGVIDTGVKEKAGKANFVYMVRCNDHSLYTGWTTDLKKRVFTHNYGEGPEAAKYTRARRPVVLVYYEVLESKSQALKRESQIKKLPKKEKEKLVSGFGKTALEEATLDNQENK